MKMAMKISSSCLVAMPFLVTLYLVLYFHRPLIDRNVRICADAKTWHRRDVTNVPELSGENFRDVLIPPAADEESCRSRFESFRYRKTPPRKVSSHLVSKLRAYEELHRRCGPGTEPYNDAAGRLKYSGAGGGSGECRYVVYIPPSGLGNRILSIAAAFLYALLSGRVLLVEFGSDVSDLFCEPFPGTTWSLPPGFPLRDRFGGMNARFPQSFGNILRNKRNVSETYLYVHLIHDYSHLDKLFFCDEHQSMVTKVPWLVLKSNNYFVPSLFLMPSFEAELAGMFPEKDTVFHHLGRYLVNPSNSVWGLVKRYHRAYLENSDELVGIQIRTFESGPGPFRHISDQILACATKEDLLPQIVTGNSRNVSVRNAPKRRDVIVTSLSSGYSDRLKELYWENPTRSGDIIVIHQPSHEEVQRTQHKSHNAKAWAEMYLLSLVDVLVTSGRSTFGYVAQGLGGLRPWMLPQSPNRTVPDPPCVRVGSIEPCFHAAPTYDCKAKRNADLGLLVPYVRHCEDISLGLKVFDD